MHNKDAFLIVGILGLWMVGCGHGYEWAVLVQSIACLVFFILSQRKRR